MRKSRTVVVFTNPLKLRRMHEIARASAPIDTVINKAYWAAWDSGAGNVIIEFDKSMTKDKQSHAWSCKFEEFEVRESRDDA